MSAETPARPEQVAVIDIGSSAIRLLIAETTRSGDWKLLESASRPVPLGQDVFVNGRISRESMRQAVQILRGFRELLDQYGIETIRTIGTSALREAVNRDIFVDRIRLRTGIDVRIIEGIEANHLTYLAVRNALKDAELGFARSNSLIMEVGSGSTEIMILRRGKMVSAHTLSIGAVRMEQKLRANLGSSLHMTKVLRERISNALDILESEAQLQSIKLFIAVGGDARLAAKRIGREQAGHYAIMKQSDFQQFVRDISPLSVDEIVRKFHISYNEADTLLPALLVYSVFADATAASRLVVPHVSIRDGVLLDISQAASPYDQREFYNQVIASTMSLGRKFHFDEKHARHAADLSLLLFDELREDHGLGSKERLLLEVASLLHDVGTYVNFSSHHKHGEYLINASDIFGMHKEDIQIVSNVVRYHRKALPSPSHIVYRSLTREERITVSKLAAILRVADAMDRGHQRRIKHFEIEKTDEELVIHCKNAGDISLEQLGIDYKADLFEEVFGLRVVLV